MSENELRHGFRKLSTDRQTDIRPRNYIPHRFAGGQKSSHVGELLANVNSSSCSLFVIDGPSVVCRL